MVKSVQEILENEVLCIAETSYQLLQISWEYMHYIMEITMEVDESAKPLTSFSMHDHKGNNKDAFIISVLWQEWETFSSWKAALI